jgi:hypothetical protein
LTPAGWASLTGAAPLPGFVAGLTVVALSAAVREARPGRVSLGMRIRGMSDLPSGMAQS